MTVRTGTGTPQDRLQAALVAVAERYLMHVQARQGAILQGDVSDVLAAFAGASSFVLVKAKSKLGTHPTAH